MADLVPVLFIDGPLAGQWRDLVPYGLIDWHYRHVECPRMTIADLGDPSAIVEITTVDYAIERATVFNRTVWVGHSGPRDLMEAGAYRYLVHPDVQARLEAHHA